MLKRKQVLIMVSIAVIFFLIGATFNIMTTAGSSGNPWKMVWEAINSLEVRVSELEAVNQGFISAPAYDSGWFPIDPNEDIVLTHNLHTTRLFVYLIGRSHYGGPGSPDYMKIHQEDYGWLDWVDGEPGHGCAWDRLDDTTITVRRGGNDEGWAEARVMIWIIEELPS